MTSPYVLQLTAIANAAHGTRPYDAVSTTTATTAHAEREPLHRRRSLAQHRDAEHHRAEGRHEVAEGGLEHPVVGDGPDVARPVDGEQDPGDDDAPPRRPVGEPSPEPAEPALVGNDGEHHEHRAHEPPADELERAERGELFPVEGDEAPQDVGDDRCLDPAPTPSQGSNAPSVDYR
ncbi:MAG: hypothetical protein WKF58_17575 [Ilumatobacteraceae bacterium]